MVTLTSLIIEPIEATQSHLDMKTKLNIEIIQRVLLISNQSSFYFKVYSKKKSFKSLLFH